jgi:S1-C subfamily serine protease
VIRSKDGQIVTDAHVVGDASQVQVQVQFADGKQAAAQVLAADKYTDLALNKGRPDRPARGDLRLEPAPRRFIGSGYRQSIGAHRHRQPEWSPTGRDLPPDEEAPDGLVGLIQTGAPISPGNSGGGLFDTAGNCIGLAEAYIPRPPAPSRSVSPTRPTRSPTSSSSSPPPATPTMPGWASPPPR